jgi:hypothetical protein
MKYVTSIACAGCGEIGICRDGGRMPSVAVGQSSWLTLNHHDFRGNLKLEQAFCSPDCAGKSLLLLAVEEDARIKRVEGKRFNDDPIRPGVTISPR